MKNFFQTNSNKLYFVTLNEDGSLFITSDGINSIENAGMFILSMGGIQRVLDRCTEEITLDEFKVRAQAHAERRQYFEEHKAEYLAAQAKRIAEKKAALQAERETRYNQLYKELVAKSNGVIETTYENIRIVLAYLNTCSWSDEPMMSIGYRFLQYNCDGKLASTIILDKPINVDGEMVTRFVFGAPHGYLCKYHRCRF